MEEKDRYAVIVVSKHTGQAYTEKIYHGEIGANSAHWLADRWNRKHQWAAFVVGLHL